MKQLLIFFLLLFPLLCTSQNEYADEAIGTWVGTISGGNLPSKKITIVITNANYKFEKGGFCEGYSLVNDANKTYFSGKLYVEADMPVIEAYEPKNNPKNGVFQLEIGCFVNFEIQDNTGCGTWTSYDKKIKRKIKVKKIK